MSAEAHSPSPELSAQIRVTLLVGMCAVSLAGLDQTIVATAQPTIVGELGGIDKVSWIFTAYMLTMAVSTPVVAKLSDVYSRRLMLQLGIFVFVVGSVGCGIAQSMNLLIVSRAVQGVGGGGLFPVAIAMIGDLVSPRQRGRYVAWLMVAFTTATVLGPTLGGWIVDSAGWRWAFFINVPVGVVAIVMAQRAPTRSRADTSHRFDVVGIALLAASTTSLLLALQWGGRQYEWTSAVIVGLFLASAGLMVTLVRWEAHTPDAIIPPRLFRSRLFSSTMVVSAGAGLLMGAGPLLFPLFLQYATGRSATGSGLLMLPISFGTLAGAMLAGRLIAKTGNYLYLVRGGFGLSAVALVFAATMDVDVDTKLLIGCMFIYGGAAACAGTVASTVSQSAVEPGDLGVGNGVNLFIRTLSVSLSVAITGAVFDSRLLDQLEQKLPPDAATDPKALHALVQEPDKVRALPPAISHAVIESIAEAVNRAFLWLVPLALAGFVFALLMRAQPLRDRAPDEQLAPIDGM